MGDFDSSRNQFGVVRSGGGEGGIGMDDISTSPQRSAFDHYAISISKNHNTHPNPDLGGLGGLGEASPTSHYQKSLELAITKITASNNSIQTSVITPMTDFHDAAWLYTEWSKVKKLLVGKLSQ